MYGLRLMVEKLLSCSPWEDVLIKLKDWSVYSFISYAYS